MDSWITNCFQDTELFLALLWNSLPFFFSQRYANNPSTTYLICNMLLTNFSFWFLYCLCGHIIKWIFICFPHISQMCQSKPCDIRLWIEWCVLLQAEAFNCWYTTSTSLFLSHDDLKGWNGIKWNGLKWKLHS